MGLLVRGEEGDFYSDLFKSTSYALSDIVSLRQRLSSNPDFRIGHVNVEDQGDYITQLYWTLAQGYLGALKKMKGLHSEKVEIFRDQLESLTSQIEEIDKGTWDPKLIIELKAIHFLTKTTVVSYICDDVLEIMRLAKTTI